MKQTEIGMIPDDWEVKKLGDICKSIASGKNKNKYPIGKFVVFGSTGIIGYTNQAVYTKPSILVARVGANAGLVNKVEGSYDVSDNTLIISGVCNDINFITEKLKYGNLNKLVFGSGQPLITGGQLRDIKLSLPPTLAEQQKIAKALSDVDNVITTLEKLITKKKNLKQGTMQQLLTGKKRLPGFGPAVVEPVETPATKQTELGEIPADWEVKELAEVAKNFTGLTYSPENINEYGTLVLRSSNIQNDMLAFEDNVYVNMNIPERAIAHTGDILICVRNGSKRLIGKSALITESANNCAFGAFMTILRTELLNQQFLFYVWQSDLIQKQIEESMGATINQITNKDIRHYLIAYPKSNTEQTAIANVLSSMDKEIEALNTKLEKYRNLKTGMMQQLLTGKIRLA